MDSVALVSEHGMTAAYISFLHIHFQWRTPIKMIYYHYQVEKKYSVQFYPVTNFLCVQFINGADVKKLINHRKKTANVYKSNKVSCPIECVTREQSHLLRQYVL